MRRAAGCGRPWSPSAFQPPGCGTPGSSWSGDRSGSPAWSSFPTPPAASSAGSPEGPSLPTGLPGSSPCPAPSRCSDLGVSAPLRRGQSSPRACSTGSPLPDGAFRRSLPWVPRAATASPPPSGAAPASSSPSTATTRAGRRRGRACSPPPRPRRFPPAALYGGTLRPLAAPRRSPAGSPAGSPARRSPIPPLSPHRRRYARFTTGSARPRLPIGNPHRSFAAGTTPQEGD